LELTKLDTASLIDCLFDNVLAISTSAEEEFADNIDVDNIEY